MNDKKRRRTFSAEQKVAIVRRYLIDNVPVFTLCEEHHIHPTLFYQWQKALFENGAAASERKGKTKPAISSSASRKNAERRKERGAQAAVGLDPVHHRSVFDQQQLGKVRTQLASLGVTEDHRGSELERGRAGPHP